MLITGIDLGDDFLIRLQEHLQNELGKSEEVTLWPIEYTRFDDGESKFRISDGTETNLELKRRLDDGERIVFVVRGECGREWRPYEMFGETLFVLDKLSEYEVDRERICTVIPCQAFAKQDRAFRHGEAVSLRTYRKYVREKSGLLINVSVHDHREEGWIEKDIFNIDAMPELVRYLEGLDLENPVVIIPDKGAMVRSQYVADELGADSIVLRKERDRKTGKLKFHFPKFFNNNSMRSAGYKEAIYVDDIANTCRTLRLANQPAVEMGLRVIDIVIHPVLAYTKIRDDGPIASFMREMEEKAERDELSERDVKRMKRMKYDLETREELWGYDIIRDVTGDFYGSDTVKSPISSYSVVERIGDAILENFR
jgi:ribose-phosphate pyrophosphokinase